MICFAQLVFALMVSVACFTSRGWTLGGVGGRRSDVARLRRWALAVVALVYVQIVFGALLRHTYSSLGPRGHFLVGFAVVAAAAWLLKEVWERHARDRALTVPATALAALVAVQVMMGVEAWLIRYFAAGAARQVLTRTAHVLVGSLVLAAAVVTALQAHRRASLADADAEEPVGCLEVVA